MHKWLVPVDSSQCAGRALDYAIGLAKEHGAIALHIVYAHEPPEAYGIIPAYLPEDKAEQELREHGQNVLKLAIAAVESADVPISSEVLVGDVAISIVKAAEDAGCDGIVMGTRGMGAVANLLLGSIATKVIHLTKVPVILIK